MVSGLTPPSKRDLDEKRDENIESLRDSVRFSAPTTNILNTMGSKVGGGGSQIVPAVQGLFATSPSERPEAIEITYTEVTTTSPLKTGDEITTGANGWTGKLIQVTNTNVSNDVNRKEALFSNTSTVPFSNTGQTFSKSGWSATYVTNTQTENALVIGSSAPIVSCTLTRGTPSTTGNPIIKQIYGTSNNGQILFMKPKDTKTLTLTTGGNIDISADVTVSDSEFVILQYFEDVNAGAGKYLLLSGGGGSSTWVPTATSDLNMAGFDILGIGVLGFTSIGGQINVADATAGFNFVTTSNRPFRFTPNATNILDITSAGLSMIAGDIDLNNLNIIGVNALMFNTTGQKIEDSPDGIEFHLTDSTESFDFINDTNTTVSFEKYFMNLTNTRIQMTEEIIPSTAPILTEHYVYVDSTSKHLTIMHNGSTVDLESGGASWVGTAASDLDMAAFEIKSTTAPTSTNWFRILFDAHDDSDTYISNTDATVDKINIFSGGNNVMSLVPTGISLFQDLTTDGDLMPSSTLADKHVGTESTPWDQMSSNKYFIGTGDGTVVMNKRNIVGDSGGIQYNVPTGDYHKFMINGQEEGINIGEDEIEFGHSGRQHKITVNGTAIQVISENQTDSVELTTGSSRTNPTLDINNETATFKTQTDEAQNYKLQITQNHNTPFNTRTIGDIEFLAENTSSVDTVYAIISSSSQNVTNGSENGLLQLGVVSNGGAYALSGMDIEGSSTGLKIGFFGESPVVQQSVSNSASVATVITALKNLGLFV
ncbi:hypothetical protein OAU44_00255 [bacterium]|nr:hypothetical protein [bacterium]